MAEEAHKMMLEFLESCKGTLKNDTISSAEFPFGLRCSAAL